MTRKIFATLLFPAILACGCAGSLKTSTNEATVTVSVDAGTVVNSGYIGNGAQWDPYSLNYGNGPVEISDADWNKIYSRLDNMRPAFVRMMQNTVSRVRDGVLDTSAGLDHLCRLLDYCQSRNVTVMFGDWGGWMVDPKAKTVNMPLIAQAADYVRFLVEEKGYTCIKYYNLINEPNGWWSTTAGDFDLWEDAMIALGREFREKGLSEKVSLVGPDTAIWSAGESWWVSRTRDEFGDIIGLYDIHTYPSKITINSGEYAEIISAYRKEVPEGKKIVMGEIGIKFVEKADSLYNNENIRRANECRHASKTDSQMFVYDYMYGTDMADALFQTINAGFSGSVVWMLDDAMHTHETQDRLKIWGFWNILGDEIFGAEQEVPRPWYYAWSLLCRYIPAGSDFNAVTVSPAVSGTALAGVRAVSAIKDGCRTLAVVNAGKDDHTVVLDAASLGRMKGARFFRYGDGLFRTEGDCTILPEQEGVNVDFTEKLKLDLPAESLFVITDMD